ncbi:hypothetical protein BJ138DRAFT_1166511 [Hygrophoropsis aurantiaca]|uniref:Uncharacterized protein n=1 Tax=Hygrophoropsis aurantiaca TaxID=72124 RepID=A0ACB7ZTD4_9AGAM|nr:hypothetical protein BJ138DRAFT_1166511 [Hygrophoropsis aurantiaca]
MIADTFQYSRDNENLRLTLAESKALHSHMCAQWAPWVRDAPASWKADGWLPSVCPLSVVCKYGQNQDIVLATPQEQEQEAANWLKERDYRRIRYMSFALATDISCREVHRWDPIDPETLIQDHPILYDSYNKRNRHQVNLANLDLVDTATKRENYVYDDDGLRVPRRSPVCRRSTAPCALLVDLRHINNLFRNVPHDLDDMYYDRHFNGDAQNGKGSRIYLYPQAFLGHFGHIQANSVLPHFAPFIDNISLDIARNGPLNTQDDLPVEEGMEEELDQHQSELRRRQALNDPESAASNVFRPVGCQFYNELSHRVRATSSTHDIQHGAVTSVLSGLYATSEKAKTAHSKIVRSCSFGLPQERFAKAIDNRDVPRAIRMENVFILDLDCVKEDKRTGRRIYLDVILPAAKAWRHPAIIQAIKPHFLILKPTVFPNIYKWTTFGITSLIKNLWAFANELIQNNRKPATTLVEITAVLERTLAYAHTGNTKVLTNGLMKPLWLVKSLVNNGMPTFSPAVRFSAIEGSPPVFHELKDWPIVKGDGCPALASTKAQLITFGQQHFEAYFAEFRIQLAIAKPPAAVFVQHPRETRTAAIVAMEGLKMFIQDVQNMVSTEVLKACKEVEVEGNIEECAKAKDRKVALKAWVACNKPLGYEDSGYAKLDVVLRGNGRDISTGLPKLNNEFFSISQFAAAIYKMCKPNASATPVPIVAPLLSTGCAAGVLRVAIPHMQSLAPDPNDALGVADFCQDALVMAADYLEICHIPWKLPATLNRGRACTKPTILTWLQITRPTMTASSMANARAPPAANTSPAVAMSQQVAASDPRATWSMLTGTLQSLHTVILRTGPPRELASSTVKIAQVERIRMETYQWVVTNFTMLRPINAIAVIASMIFIRLLPELHYDTMYKDTDLSDGAALTRYIRKIPWIASTRRGVTQGEPFALMVPAYIIGVYEKNSPLRQNSEATGSLSNEWTKAHIAKFIGPINMIRLGIARALKKKVLYSGQFNIDWEFIGEDEMVSLYNKIKLALRDHQFGPFEVTRMFVGHETAVMLGTIKAQYSVPPNYIPQTNAGPSAAQRSSNRRRRQTGDHDSDDDEHSRNTRRRLS